MFKKIFINRYIFIIEVSIFLVFIENIFTFANKFIINKNAHISLVQNINYLITEALLSFIVVVLFLTIFSFSKFLLKFFIIFFLLVSSGFMYYIYSTKIIIDEFLIGNLLETTKNEASSFFSMWELLFIIILGVIPSLFIIKYVRFKTLSIKKFLISFVKYIVIPLSVSYVLIFIFNRHIVSRDINAKVALSSYLPINYSAGIVQYFHRLRKGIIAQKKLIKVEEKYNFTFSNDFKNKPLTVVLVVGESARAKNQHSNGYFRQTNEYTEKIPNLVNFSQMYSCGTYTRYSLACLLSRKSQKDFSLPPTETNLISIFKSLGFKTYWFSGQTAYEKKYNTIFASAQEASETYFLSAIKPLAASTKKPHDELLFQLIDKALVSNYKQKLIVIQLKGSHVSYEDSYPENFKKFKPTCTSKSCTPKEDLNSYDNSILYSDWFLATLIGKLKKENSLLFYSSDHGESLRVDNSGFVFHSAPYDIAPIEQKHVWSFMWFSDSMRKLQPRLDNVKYYKNKKLSQDNIFHTLFNCIGISSSIIDPNLSLCSLPKK